MKISLKEVREIVQEELLESRIREADISDNKKTSWGSDEHIEDLKDRISQFEYWRSKYKKGSESRANYSRIIQKLKAELNSAEKTKNKNGRRVR